MAVLGSPSNELVDPFGRTIDYLRVSITDRCNFRCVYCMPEQGFRCTPKDEHLTLAEMARLVRVAMRLGVRKVRLTGGEPLVRRDLTELVEALSGAEDLSLTTNGHLLSKTAVELKKAGLHRVNVSLDTLNPDRFVAIARRGSLEAVLRGIRAAQAAGLDPIKVNCVVLRGLNDQEAPAFARWTLEQEVHVRFIEVMPMRWNLDESVGFDSFAAHNGRGLLQITDKPGDMLSDAQLRRMYVPTSETRVLIEREVGPLAEAQVKTNGPARTYRLSGARGTVGFISQISSDFCSRCNRLRLTHDGFLRPCLMSDGELDLRTPLRQGATDDDLADLFRHVVQHKPARHYLAEGQKVTGRGMSQIGG